MMAQPLQTAKPRQNMTIIRKVVASILMMINKMSHKYIFSIIKSRMDHELNIQSTIYMMVVMISLYNLQQENCNRDNFSEYSTHIDLLYYGNVIN